MGPSTNDASNGYEAVAALYIAGRGTRSRAVMRSAPQILCPWNCALGDRAEGGCDPGIAADQSLLQIVRARMRLFSESPI